MVQGSKTSSHEFNDNLEPARPTPSPAAWVTRKTAVKHNERLLGLLEERRVVKRSRSLSLTKRNHVDTTFLEQQYKARSGDSLDWDNHQVKLSFNQGDGENDWSNQTQFSVTILDREGSTTPPYLLQEGRGTSVSQQQGRRKEPNLLHFLRYCSNPHNSTVNQTLIQAQ